jgi:putative heme-binding domain-containing protein
MLRRIFAAAVLFAAPLPAVLQAQTHNYTQRDIEEGARAFRSNCIGCHGPEGNQVTGVDLGHGRFRRVSTDEDIVHVIMNGVPGTGMPPFPLTAPRAYTIVAYLRNMNTGKYAESIAAPAGDIRRGRGLFEGRAHCADCHRAGGAGGRSGPDLSEEGLQLRAIQIESSLLDPNAEYGSASRPVVLQKRDGTSVQGLLLNQSAYSVEIQDAHGELLSVDRARLDHVDFVKSPMPSYRGKLDAEELADLIAYVGSLKGAASP